MSQAFVKDEDDQWLHDVSPTVNSLINYLARENNGIRVYERRNYFDNASGKEVHEMSNGLSYTKDNHNKWMIFE